ncbi:MAG TPA: DOMON-like domain-containing protein [Candidatus Binatia bacterium]
MTGTFAAARGRSEPALTPLVHHPTTPPSAALEVSGGAALEGTTLWLRFVLHGELARIALPAPASAPRRRDELWRHTCCEAFLGAATRPAYVEANFAPTGDWALYAFDDRRRGMRDVPLARAPRSATRSDARTLTLDVLLDLEPVAALLGPPPYALGLSAVVEEHDGKVAYFALAHPGAHPDFHDPGGWSASLAARAGS